MKSVDLVSIGFEAGAIKGWEEFVPQVRAPRNYKDQNKIATYEAEARQRQSEEVCENPVTAEIIKLVAVETNADGTARVLTTHDSLGQLLTKFTKGRSTLIPVVPRGAFLFEQALIEAVSTGKDADIFTAIRLAPMFPREYVAPTPYIDPLQVLKAGSKLEDVLPMLRRLKVECKDYSMNTAEWWAHIGYTLAERLDLEHAIEALSR